MSIQNSGSIPSKPWYKLIAPASDLHQSYRDTVHGIFLGPVTLSMLVAQYVEEVSCDIIMLVAPRICSRFKSEHKLYFLSKYWKGNLKTYLIISMLPLKGSFFSIEVEHFEGEIHVPHPNQVCRWKSLPPS